MSSNPKVDRQPPFPHTIRRTTLRLLLAAGSVAMLAIAALLVRALVLSHVVKDNGFAHSYIETPETHSGNPGPWGQIEYTEIALDPPENLVDSILKDERPLRWVFKGHGLPELRKKLSALPLGADERDALLKAKWSSSANQTLIEVSPELAIGLSAQGRAAIYRELAQWPENDGQHLPLTLRADSLDAWLSDSALSDKTQALLRPLFIPQGDFTVFADYRAVLASPLPVDEKQRLIRAWIKQPTLLLKLKVGPFSNLDELTRYWDWGGGARMRTVLRSLHQSSEGYRLDAAHLLTPFGRKLLHTWSEPPMSRWPSRSQAMWTAGNFFRIGPDASLKDLDAFLSEITENYYQLPGHPGLGDVVAFLGKDTGQALHACVYIADDIVFTTVPSPFPSPWVFMALDDLEDRFASHGPLNTAVFRKKDS